MSEILFADDDAAMREMVSAILDSAGHNARVVRDGRSALQEVRARAPELVILDYRMGTPNGLEVCREIKSDPRLEHLPVLILTAQGGVEDRIDGFDAGANDYLAKPFDARELLARINALLRLSRQGLDRNPTSGLPGGGAISREFERRRKGGSGFSICYLDLDHFKPFSDSFGFSMADRVIREIGDLLVETAGGSPTFVGHVGGDDFLMLCERADARRQVEQAQRLFAAQLRKMLPQEVSRSGTYQGKDREGTAREFPLTRLAAAIVHLAPGSVRNWEELGERIASVKQRAKNETETGIAEIELNE